MNEFGSIALDHINNKRRYGKLQNLTHRGSIGEKGNGPYMRLFFQIKNNVIIDSSYETYGCPSSIACASVLAEISIGRDVQLLLELTSKDVINLLQGIPEGKEHCAEMAIQTLRSAFADTTKTNKEK